MPLLKAYHRPTTIEAVLQLLSRPQVHTVLIAGGTYINARLEEPAAEVVDLQAAGLDTVHYELGQLTLGAMARLQTMVDDEKAPPLLRQMAHREGPNTLRYAATIGGVVVGGDWESELLAALLVFEATVTARSALGVQTIALPDFLANPRAALRGGLVTAISLQTGGKTASEQVARTPADRPIVAAVGRLTEAGQLRLALCGAASTPILVNPEQPLQDLRRASPLNPPADFRGSSAYRRQMALLLAGRVVEQLKAAKK